MLKWLWYHFFIAGIRKNAFYPSGPAAALKSNPQKQKTVVLKC
ncbi:hypothetical protein DCCM_3951 [Desulfocucumis palustris]|uniref:Uncharacterized protein n=1 Tax=Desulfocucumis palustris TaxID=1898651 RepID=A0A2L2XLK1_9FIRM|nr:hypothetical protein DCCM_3951 [Desulfocucumis palustris]